MAGHITSTADKELVLSRMHYYDEHPKKSQRFMDIFPIFTSPKATEAVIANLAGHIASTYDVENEVIAIVGPEAEGFVLGPLIAVRLGIPFIPARKQRKLPGDVQQQGYSKWSGSDVFEMQNDAFKGLDSRKGAIIVDDSVASGGSAGGVKRLIERLGVKVLCACFIYEAVMPEHKQAQREALGDLEIYAMLEVSEKTLRAMELHKGKKDEDGNYTGDAGGSEAAPASFQHY